jgi:hypothetical protein
MQVTHEFYVDQICAYIITYGEYDDGEDTAEVRSTQAATRWSPEELRHMHIGEEIEGYAPIYTCGYCGEEHEGDGQHSAVVLG